MGFLLLDLDEVAAGVVEDRGDDGAEVGWGLDEVHAFCLETLVFGLDVVDGEGGAGNAVRHNGVYERTDRGMVIRLKQKLRPLGVFRGYHGDPGVLAQGDVVLELEAKRFGVEAERLLLVVHEDAGEVDSHRLRVPFICRDRPTLGDGLERVALIPMELGPAHAPGANQPGGLQDAQVLGDGLPRGVDAVLHGQACAEFEERLT